MTDLPSLIATTMHYARVSERLGATIATLRPVTTALSYLIDLDPELEPEARVALAHLTEVLAALDRADTFNKTRADVTLDNLREEQK